MRPRSTTIRGLAFICSLIYDAAMRYDRDIIERVRQALRDAPAREPKPTELTGRMRLAPDLLKARSEKNLSWDEVLALVENAGVKISDRNSEKIFARREARWAPSTARAAKSKAPPNPKAKASSSSKPPSPGGPAEMRQGQAKPTPRCQSLHRPRAAEGSQGQARPIPPMPKPPPPGRSPDAAQGDRKPIPPMPKPPPPGTASVEKSETEDEEVVPAWSFPLRRDRDRI